MSRQSHGRVKVTSYGPSVEEQTLRRGRITGEMFGLRPWMNKDVGCYRNVDLTDRYLQMVFKSTKVVWNKVTVIFDVESVYLWESSSS